MRALPLTYAPPDCPQLSKLVYKPHSVFLLWQSRRKNGDHLSGSAIASALVRPTRAYDGASRSAHGMEVALQSHASPCLALLPVGFA
jgi:hypothetical protein